MRGFHEKILRVKLSLSELTLPILPPLCYYFPINIVTVKELFL